jgi:hypothetical protein
VLVHEEIGLEEIDDGLWMVHFGPIRLGVLDERHGRIEATRGLETSARNC